MGYSLWLEHYLHSEWGPEDSLLSGWGQGQICPRMDCKYSQASEGYLRDASVYICMLGERGGAYFNLNLAFLGPQELLTSLLSALWGVLAQDL